MNMNTFVTKTGWNSLNWYFRTGVHKVFGKHRLTHSLMDIGHAQNSMPLAPNAVEGQNSLLFIHKYKTNNQTY